MTELAPKPPSPHELNQIRVARIQNEHIKFERIMLGGAPAAFKAFEDEAQPLIATLLPLCPPEWQRAVVRIVALYVVNAEGLVEYLQPRMIDMMGSYGYGHEDDPNKAEGTSVFWLYQGTNAHLQMIDGGNLGGMAPYLTANPHYLFQVRALGRILCLFGEVEAIPMLAKIKAVALKHQLGDLSRGKGLNQVSHENFTIYGAEETAPKLNS